MVLGEEDIGSIKSRGYPANLFLLINPFPHAHFCIPWLSTFSSDASHPSPGQAQKQSKKVCIPNLAVTNASQMIKGCWTGRANLRHESSIFCVVVGSRSPRGIAPAPVSQKNGRRRRFVGFALVISGAGNVLTLPFA